MVIHQVDQRVSPTLYLENAYEHAKNTPFEIPNSFKFKYVKARICYRIVNTYKNFSRLENLPHRSILDLTLIYTIQLKDEHASITITNSILRDWDVTEETLYEYASTNTERIFPSQIIDMESMLLQMISSDDISELKPNNTGLYVATKINNSFFILPSSVHELLFLP